MKLYQLPYSHHGAEVRVALLETSIARELPPIPGGLVRSPELLAIAPLAKVPVLVHGADCEAALAKG
jgi:glutathione S-transferase